MRVEYRQGLPSVEQVREHEKRGGWWMSTDGKTVSVHRLTIFGQDRICMVNNWDDRASIDLTGLCGDARYRPVSPDGEPAPWPDLATLSTPRCSNCGDSFDAPERDCPNPSPGKPYVDCGRGGHMFDVGPVLFAAEPAEDEAAYHAKRADRALDLLRQERDAFREERALRVQEATALREELHHLRQGIDLFRSAYLSATAVRPGAKRPQIEVWIIEDQIREDRRRVDALPEYPDPGDR